MSAFKDFRNLKRRFSGNCFGAKNVPGNFFTLRFSGSENDAGDPPNPVRGLSEHSLLLGDACFPRGAGCQGWGWKRWFLHAFRDSSRPGGEKRKLYAYPRLSWIASPPSAPVSRGKRGFCTLPLEHLANDHLNSVFTQFLWEIWRFWRTGLFSSFLINFK